jgi:hypothetical protein
MYSNSFKNILLSSIHFQEGGIIFAIPTTPRCGRGKEGEKLNHLTSSPALSPAELW